MLPIRRTFTSPQTGSIYKIITKISDIILCYREVDGTFRVRIQCNNTYGLNRIIQNLIRSDLWGSIKSDDHISVDCYASDLKNVLADALRAIVMLFE